MSPPRRRATLAAQDGFTMVVTMGVLLVAGLFVAVAFSNVVGDLPLVQGIKDRKSAYAAAESGVNFYLAKLGQDNDYWTSCANGPAPGDGSANPVMVADPHAALPYRDIPGQTRARYAVELLPFTGSTCSQTTMLDPSTGNLRIRGDGISATKRRSIIATLRRVSFLQYLYFTDYDTTDPLAYPPQYQTAAQQSCTFYRAQRNAGCFEIQFTDQDRINGPFHTNDDILACAGATFGRTADDRVEVSGAAPGYRNPSGCTQGQPTFKSTFQTGAPQLAMPTSNAAITTAAAAPNVLTGTYTVKIADGSMAVTPGSPTAPTGPTTTMPVPANGVLYDKQGSGCGSGVVPALQDYTEPAGCANLYVSGRYASSLTIVSDKDIVVTADLTRRDDGPVLGLIATNFVRIYHPVRNRVVCSQVDQGNGVCYVGTTKSCDNDTGTPQNLGLDAAILSLQHSFTVDNYDCGAQLGTLSVFGAIAQKYRGAVGAVNASGTHGYTKSYTYDDRFRFRNPPYFLDPVNAAWQIVRQNEQAIPR